MNSRELMKITAKKKYTLSELIDWVKYNSTIVEEFCLFTEDECENIEQNLNCYLDNYPKIDEMDKEIYSDFVIDNNLKLLMYGDQFEDVIRSILFQKPEASMEEIIQALNHYLENDAFLTL